MGYAEIVRQGSRHEERQTLVVNRAPRTAAATRHCIPVLGVGHVLLSSPPTRTFNRTPFRSGSSAAFAGSEARINAVEPAVASRASTPVPWRKRRARRREAPGGFFAVEFRADHARRATSVRASNPPPCRCRAKLQRPG